MSNIEIKLKELCSFSDKALNIVNGSTAHLFRVMADDAKKCKFDFSKKHDDLIDDILYHGVVSDSASFVYDSILSSKNAKLIDINLTRVNHDRVTLKAIIEDALLQASTSDRGFVYVAWKSRPEEYYYVGKASSSARVNLNSHGTLLEALKDSSRLSFLMPAKSTANVLSNLEAAMIHLIEYKTGAIPRENSRKETFKLDYECREELKQIRSLVSRIHNRMNY